METIGMVTIPTEQFELLVREYQRMSLVVEKLEQEKSVLQEKLSMLEYTFIPLLRKIAKDS